MTHPLFTVIVPTYNRCAALRTTLEAYEAQHPVDLPFEVIVVDDGSSDATPELLKNWRSRRFAYRCITQSNQGPAGARNHALQLARGSLVLFTGDDVEPSPHLLLEHWQAHATRFDSTVAILGQTRWPADAELTATMRHIDGEGAQQFSYHFMTDGNVYDYRHFYTSNISLRRELLLQEASGFRTDFPAAAFEDTELSYRLARHGLKIVYHEAAIGFHHHAYDARSFFIRQQRCGEMATVLYAVQPQLVEWTGLNKTEEARLKSLTIDAESYHLIEKVRSDLAAYENRVLNLASYFDPIQGSAIDTLLLPLFTYGFLKGAASRFFASDSAQRCCAALYVQLFPKPVRHFVTQQHQRWLPIPIADTQALLSLSPAVETGC